MVLDDYVMAQHTLATWIHFFTFDMNMICIQVAGVPFFKYAWSVWKDEINMIIIKIIHKNR